MKILAIESSCDETSASVVVNSKPPKILSNVINSQIEIHKKYGGVIPEFAARNHLDNIDTVINEALNIADTKINDIDVIAATAGPGLIGGLLVGLVTAKTIAMMLDKPFMAINHLEAHILTPRLCYEDLHFPYLTLLTSGGHFVFVEVIGVGNYKILGETLDDAAGEAFDKVAKMLELEYPGGPSIEKHAENGDHNRFKYTTPLMKQSGCNGSFSGIKTATRLHINSLGDAITEIDKRDIAASFQHIVVRFIMRQFEKALNMASSKNIRNVVVAGGVAANKYLRLEMQKFADKKNLKFYAPPINLCSDNAAMIGWCAIERINAGVQYSTLDVPARPRWPLTEMNS